MFMFKYHSHIKLPNATNAMKRHTKSKETTSTIYRAILQFSFCMHLFLKSG